MANFQRLPLNKLQGSYFHAFEKAVRKLHLSLLRPPTFFCCDLGYQQIWVKGNWPAILVYLYPFVSVSIDLATGFDNGEFFPSTVYLSFQVRPYGSATDVVVNCH